MKWLPLKKSVKILTFEAADVLKRVKRGRRSFFTGFKIKPQIVDYYSTGLL
jgi:hypothetical protein